MAISSILYSPKSSDCDLQQLLKMAPLLCSVNDLHPSLITSAIKIRVVRAYGLLFNGDSQHMMSFECILQDEEGVKIHASFARNLAGSAASKIKEGCCYDFYKFYMRPNHMRFKTTDHEFRIVMTQKSQIFEITADDFPNEMFSFRTFAEIAGIKSVGDAALFDVIGVIVESGGVINQPNRKMLEIKIEDENHDSVVCTLWEEYVDEFLSQIDPNVKQIPIVLIQYCRPISYEGEIRISTSYNVSRVLLNRDTPIMNEFRQRIFGNIRFFKIANLTFNHESRRMVDETENLEVKSIEDVFCLEFLDFCDTLDSSYWICGKVDNVEAIHEWWYMGCTRCGKKVTQVDNKFYCDACKKYDGVANKRFMVKVNVVDASSDATMLLWDREYVKLLGKRAWEIDVEGVEPRDSCNIPKEIKEKFLHRVILFKVQLRNDGDFRFDEPYTVKKICITPEIVEKHAAEFLYSLNDVKSQNDSAKSFSDISFADDVVTEMQIPVSETDEAYGGDFEKIVKEGNELIETGKRKIENLFEESVNVKKGKLNVKVEKE
ncbi:replication protein A 70 kDa DNA-binding subunit B-like [Salvia miltiorrhiza]|uniref:replication protein A 70 kDa DNA-binding subunit B-like n=1 Tax=Salvia miltiorrhiza TaxID=226208 RepID=UPI0025AD3926|nr:replication protein A 70 kDa DNA-binding subunit B-like [Salvia miltiorrhiza]